MEEKRDNESCRIPKVNQVSGFFSNQNESSLENGKGKKSEALNINVEAASVSLKQTAVEFTYMSSIFNETLCTVISPTLSDLQRNAESDQLSIIKSWRTVDERESRPITCLAIDDTVPSTVCISFTQSVSSELPLISAASVCTQCNTLYFDSPDDHFTMYERILFEQQKQRMTPDGLGDFQRMATASSFPNCFLRMGNQENDMSETLKVLQKFCLNAAKVSSQWQSDQFQIPPIWHREMLVYMGGGGSKIDKGRKKDKKKQEKEDKKKRKEKKSEKEEKKAKKSSKKLSKNTSMLSRQASKSSTDAASVRSKSAMLSDSSEGGSSVSRSSSDCRSHRKSRETRKDKKTKKNSKMSRNSKLSKESRLSGKNDSKLSSTDQGEDDRSSATSRSGELVANGMPSSPSKRSSESKVKVVKNDDERAQVFGSAEESSAEESRGHPVSSTNGKFSKGSKNSKRSKSQRKSSKRTNEDSKGIRESDDQSEDSLRSEDEGRDTQRIKEEGIDTKRSKEESKGSRLSKGSKKRSKNDSKKDSRLLETLIEDRDGTTPQGAQSTTVEGEINFDESGEGEEFTGEHGSKDGLSADEKERGSNSKDPFSGRGSNSRKSDSKNMGGRSGSRDSRGSGSRDRSRDCRGFSGGSQGRGSVSRRMSGSQGRGSDSRRMSGSQGRGSKSPRKSDSLNAGSRKSGGLSGRGSRDRSSGLPGVSGRRYRDQSSDSRDFSGGGSRDPVIESLRSDSDGSHASRGMSSGCSRGMSRSVSRGMSRSGSQNNPFSRGRDSRDKFLGDSRDISQIMSGNQSTAKEREVSLKIYETSDYIIQCPCKRHCAETTTEFTNEDAGVPTELVMPQIVMVDALSSRLPVDKPEKHPEMHLAPKRYECVCSGPCMCPKPTFIPSKCRILSLADYCKICVVCTADCPIKSSFTAVFCSECNGNLCGNCAVNHHFNVPEHFIHDIYGNAIVFCKIHPPDDMSKGPLLQKRHCQKCHSILHKCRMHLQCNKNAIPKVKRYGRILPKRGECYNNSKKCCGLESRMETCTCSKSCIGKSGKDSTCKVHGDVVVKDPTFYSFSECYSLCVVCGTEVSKSPFSCVFCDECKGNICSVCVAFHYGYLDHTLRNSVGSSIHLCVFHSRQMPKKSWEKIRDPAQPDYNCVVCHAMSLASMAPITRTQFEPLKKFMKTKSAKVRGRRAAVARRTLNEQLMGPIPSRKGQRGATKVDWNNKGATLRMLSARGIVSKEISVSQIIEAAEKIGMNKERLMRMIAKNKIKICAKEKCVQHLRHPYFEKVRGPRSTYARRIRRLREVNVAKRRDKDDKPLLSPNWLSKMIAESKHKKIYNPNAGLKDDKTLDLIEAEKKMSQIIDRFEMRAANAYPYEWKTDPIKNYNGIPNPKLHTNCGSTWNSSMPFEQERYFWKRRGDT